MKISWLRAVIGDVPARVALVQSESGELEEEHTHGCLLAAGKDAGYGGWAGFAVAVVWSFGEHMMQLLVG